jgi:hypothetical protein
VDQELLAKARQARRRMANAERDATAARAEFHGAVRRLVSASESPREVAAVLGLSHEQLQEIMQGTDPQGRRPPGSALSCSFCARPQHEVRKLIAGPGVYICDVCVGLAGGVTGSGCPAATRLGQLRAVPEQDSQAHCSFCGKHRDRLASLAALSPEPEPKAELQAEPEAEPEAEAPNEPAAICPECVSLCEEILTEELT